LIKVYSSFFNDFEDFKLEIFWELKARVASVTSIHNTIIPDGLARIQGILVNSLTGSMRGD